MNTACVYTYSIQHLRSSAHIHAYSMDSGYVSTWSGLGGLDLEGMAAPKTRCPGLLRPGQIMNQDPPCTLK